MYFLIFVFRLHLEMLRLLLSVLEIQEFEVLESNRSKSCARQIPYPLYYFLIALLETGILNFV